MKKLLLITIILLLQSFPSFGEWKKVVEKKDTEVLTHSLYLDEDSIVKSEGFLYVWSLDDYKNNDRDGVKSVILYQKFDCKRRRNKTLIIHFYGENMGRGDVINTVKDKETEVEWNYPIPNTMGDDLLNKVCGN